MSSVRPESTFFKDNDLHLHVPEGAIPKDGPSAGITMATAFISKALGIPAPADIAMTGEVSLTGKVLAVGGVKEKSIAARRAFINRLIVPKDCERDVAELPAYLKDGIEWHFVSEYDQVYELVFPGAQATMQPAAEPAVSIAAE